VITAAIGLAAGGVGWIGGRLLGSSSDKPGAAPESARQFTPVPATPSEQRLGGWPARLPGNYGSAPLPQGETIYLADDHGEVHALAARTGSPLWAFPTGGIVQSDLLAVAGTLYFGNGIGAPGTPGTSGAVFALDAATGRQRWRFPTGDYVNCSPMVVGDVVYAGSYDANVYALRAADGQEVWRTPTAGQVHELLRVHRGLLYVAGFPGVLYALDLAGGDVRWSLDAESNITPFSAELGGRLYIVRDSGLGADSQPLAAKMYALDAISGEEIWSFSAERIDSPVHSGELIYLGSERGVLALDARSGREIWRFPLAGPGGMTLAASDDVIYAVDGNEIYALDRLRGSRQWSTTVDVRAKETLITVPIAAAGTLYIGGTEGGLYGLSTVHGEKRWTASAHAYVNHLVMANGILYASTVDGLYAFKDGEPLR
jgi:outer membrane protein assembly factor BamB